MTRWEERLKKEKRARAKTGGEILKDAKEKARVEKRWQSWVTVARRRNLEGGSTATSMGPHHGPTSMNASVDYVSPEEFELMCEEREMAA